MTLSVFILRVNTSRSKRHDVWQFNCHSSSLIGYLKRGRPKSLEAHSKNKYTQERIDSKAPSHGLLVSSQP